VSERIYSEVVPLLSCGDAKVRKYAVEKMIRHIDTLGRKELLQYFGASVDDENEEVSKAAKYGMSILFHRDEQKKINFSGSMAVINPSVVVPGTDEMRQIRQAAESVLEPVIEKLKVMALDKADSEMGIYAVRMLGRFAFPGTLETLYGATKIEDRAIDSVHALSRFNPEEALFLLRKFLSRSSDEGMRCAILTAISNFQLPEIVEILGKHCNNPDSMVRACVARALGKWKSPEACTILVKMLDDEDVQVAGNAIDSLSIIGYEDAAVKVLEMTDRGFDKRLRSRATTALGFLKAPSVLEPLKLLLGSSDHRIVANALESLAFYELQRSEIITLVGPLLGHPSNRVRGNAIKYMYSVEPGRAVRELQILLQSPVRLDRATGAYLVGEIGTVDVAKWLVTLVSNERETTVLSAALNALEKLERSEIKPALNRLFKHPNATIRSQAVRVYSTVADRSGMRVLDDLLAAEKVQTVRSAIIAAMGNLGSSGNFMLLVKHLQDRNERVVANTIEALDRVGSLEITPFVSPFLKNSVNRIRANTIVTLWKLGDLKVAEDLFDMVSSGDSDSIRSAFHVLRNISDFLNPALLVERPLLLSSLRDKFRLRSRKKDVSVTEITNDFAEIFKIEEEYAEPTEKSDLSAVLASRAIDDKVEMKVALKNMLATNPASSIGNYLSKELIEDGGSNDLVNEKELNDRYREGWKEDSFLPGLFDLLESARKKKDLKLFLNEYLTIFQVQLKLYSTLMERAGNLLEAGETASVQRIVKFMVECVPVKNSLHSELGDVAYDVRDHDLAYQHLLANFVAVPEDCQSALKLCSAALHCGNRDLAETVVDILLQMENIDDSVVEKAKRLKQLIAGS
jgi:HEAT repeat protein